MVNWKDLFRKKILDRGQDYYDEGAVCDMEQTAKGYHAIVQGTDDYGVDVEISGHQVIDMQCSCPFAESGQYCKHMAAVLFKIYEENPEEPDSTEPWDIKLKRKQEQLQKLVTRLSIEELRKIVLEYLNKDKDAENKFLLQHADTIDASHLKKLKEQISEIAYEYSDRGGFVDYYHALDFTSALEDFLQINVKILLDKNCNMQAFEIVNQVFHLIGNIDIDDSDGGTGEIANCCYDYWKQILENCSKQEKQQIFQWFEKHQNTDFVIDYLEEYISDFLTNEFHDPELLQKKLVMLDKQIEAAGKSSDSGNDWSMRYGTTQNILKRLEIRLNHKFCGIKDF